MHWIKKDDITFDPVYHSRSEHRQNIVCLCVSYPPTYISIYMYTHTNTPKRDPSYIKFLNRYFLCSYTSVCVCMWVYIHVTLSILNFDRCVRLCVCVTETKQTPKLVYGCHTENTVRVLVQFKYPPP